MPNCPPSIAAVLDDVVWEALDQPPDDQATLAPRLGPGSTWSVGSNIVSWFPGRPDLVAASSARLQWLAARMPTVTVVVVDGEWLVATAPPGPAVARPDLHPRPDELPAAMGVALRALHDLAIDGHPFTTTWTERVAEIEAARDADRFDVGRLIAPYDRYGIDELLDFIHQGRPAETDLVVGHGRPVVGNVHLQGRSLAAFTGLDRLGLADRHQDLAIAHRSLLDAFGGEAIIGFFEGYGMDPDLVRLDHYILLDVVSEAVT